MFTSSQMEDVKREGLIYGVHPVRSALREGRVQRLWVLIGQKHVNTIAGEARRLNVPVSYVGREWFDSHLGGTRHQGVAAYVGGVEMRQWDRLLGEAPSRCVFVLLDGVTDVKNVGAVARNALAFGARGLLLPVRGGASITAEAVKASAGALLRLSIARYRSLQKTLIFAKEVGFHVVAATVEGGVPLWEAPLEFARLLLVAGDEHRGLSPTVFQLADLRVTIPISPEGESLNVSVAVGILLYEVSKRWHSHHGAK